MPALLGANLHFLHFMCQEDETFACVAKRGCSPGTALLSPLLAVVNGELTLDQDFNENLQNSSSQEYQELSTAVCDQVRVRVRSGSGSGSESGSQSGQSQGHSQVRVTVGQGLQSGHGKGCRIKGSGSGFSFWE